MGGSPFARFGSIASAGGASAFVSDGGSAAQLADDRSSEASSVLAILASFGSRERCMSSLLALSTAPVRRRGLQEASPAVRPNCALDGTKDSAQTWS